MSSDKKRGPRKAGGFTPTTGPGSFHVRNGVTREVQASALKARKDLEKKQKMRETVAQVIEQHDNRSDELAEQQALKKAKARAAALEAAALSDLRADEQDEDDRISLSPEDPELESASQEARARLAQRRRGSMDSISSTASDGSGLSDLSNDPRRSIQDFDNTDPGKFFGIDRTSPFDRFLKGRGPSSSESTNPGYPQRPSSMNLLARALAPDPDDAELEAALQRAKARVDSRINAASLKTGGLEGAPEYVEGSMFQRDSGPEGGKPIPRKGDFSEGGPQPYATGPMFQSDVGPESGPVRQGHASEGAPSPSIFSRLISTATSAVMRFLGRSPEGQDTAMSVSRPPSHIKNELYEEFNPRNSGSRAPNPLYDRAPTTMHANKLYELEPPSLPPAYPAYVQMTAPKPDSSVLARLETSRAPSPARPAPPLPPRPAHLIKPPMPAPAYDAVKAAGPDQKPGADAPAQESPKPRSPSFRI